MAPAPSLKILALSDKLIADSESEGMPFTPSCPPTPGEQEALIDQATGDKASRMLRNVQELRDKQRRLWEFGRAAMSLSCRWPGQVW